MYWVEKVLESLRWSIASSDSTGKIHGPLQRATQATALRQASNVTWDTKMDQVELYDTPGLGNERNAQIVLDQICKETNDEVDVVLFCIALSRGIRVDDGYYKLISLLTKMFGQNFWSKTIFVLTLVNDSPYKEVSQGELHRRTIQNVKQELERAMRIANVDSSIAESVPLLPAGYERGCFQHEAREWSETLFNECRERESVRSEVPLLQRKGHHRICRVAVIGVLQWLLV